MRTSFPQHHLKTGKLLFIFDILFYMQRIFHCIHSCNPSMKLYGFKGTSTTVIFLTSSFI